MAKHKKKRKSSKCPEPFDSMLNLAGGIAMDAIANSMEKKHHYRQRGVPNPYRASAFGIASGHMKTTEDVIRLGGIMGAMGAFDDDTEFQSDQFSEPWEFDDIGTEGAKSGNNRYAWRLNCEDGRRKKRMKHITSNIIILTRAGIASHEYYTLYCRKNQRKLLPSGNRRVREAPVALLQAPDCRGGG